MLEHRKFISRRRYLGIAMVAVLLPTLALAFITAAIKELSRSDTPYSVGVVDDQATGGQIVFFDLPRVSPLQFNVTKDVSGRQQLIDKIKSAIVECLGIE